MPSPIPRHRRLGLEASPEHQHVSEVRLNPSWNPVYLSVCGQQQQVLQPEHLH